MMEEAYYADRVQLQHLLQQYPTWTGQQYAEATGRSLGWVKKWKTRLRNANGNPDALRSLSRRPHTTPLPIQEPVIRRILEIRDQPPQHLQRTPGPLAIRYYLQQDETLKASGLHLPTSTSTLWRILDQHQRIQRPRRLPHEPLERPEPMRCWQLDFKDVSTVPPDPDGKQMHMVETMNIVDEGTSRVVSAVVRADFTMESTLEAVTEVLQEQGLPEQIQFDRDSRFVGSWTGRDFPSPFVRFWQNSAQLHRVGAHHLQENTFNPNALILQGWRQVTEHILRDGCQEIISSVRVRFRHHTPPLAKYRTSAPTIWA